MDPRETRIQAGIRIMDDQECKIGEVLNSKKYSTKIELVERLNSKTEITLGARMRISDVFWEHLVNSPGNDEDNYSYDIYDDLSDRNSNALQCYNSGNFAAARRLWGHVINIYYPIFISLFLYAFFLASVFHF